MKFLFCAIKAAKNIIHGRLNIYFLSNWMGPQPWVELMTAIVNRVYILLLLFRRTVYQRVEI